MNDALNIQLVTESVFDSVWFAIAISVIFFITLVYFFKKYTGLKLENFESYSSHQELVVKMRTLSILSLILFPLTEYYESVFLQLYPTNWIPIIIISAVSVLSLIVSFNTNLSFSFLNFLPQASYYIIYFLLVFKSLKAEMLPIMAIETACLVLFSKLIFSKLKNLLYFLSFVAISNILLINHYSINEYNLDIYLSALIQSCIVSISLYLIEGSSNRKVAFGNKILESSNLYVIVVDSSANIIYMNNGLENLIGFKQNKIQKDNWWNYIGYNEDSSTSLKKFISESILKNQFSNRESIINDTLGNTLYISWDNSIIEEKYMLAVGKNITQAKLLQLDEDNRKEKVQRYSKVISSLSKLQYTEKNNLDDLLETITKTVSDAMQVDRVSIWNYSDNQIICQKQFDSISIVPEGEVILSRNDYPIYFKAISEGRIINASEASKHADTFEFNNSYFDNTGVKSLLDIPIFINGELKGVLCCENSGIIKHWDSEDINFAKGIADFAALTIEGAKRKELEYEHQFILNNVGDIIYTTDAIGNFDFINKTAANLLGYNIEELKGKHFTSIIHPEYKKRISIFYLKQFKERKESTYQEFKVITSSGQNYWVGQTVKLVIDPNNREKIKGFQAVVRDINKQKEVEFALTESENNFRQINESISDVFFLYSFEKKRYDYISPNCKKVLGADAEFFYQGNNYSDAFLHPADKARLAELNASEKNKSDYAIEYRIILNDKIRWIEERAFSVKNENGTVIKICGICSDITENKEQKEQLKQLSLVAQTVSNGVVITSPEGLIEWCNESYLTLMGYALDEIIGKRPIDLFSGPETKQNIKEKIKGTKLEGDSIEILQYTKSGKPLWLMITNTPVNDSKGNVEKYVEIITDITERKQLESDYRYIIDNAGDVIYTTNDIGEIQFLNESVTKIIGYAPNDLIGKHFTYIIHPDDKKRVALFYMKQLKSSKEDSYLELLINKVV